MANQQKESIVNKLIAFVTDKKKLPLLLLLLGGGATVVTGTVLLANPGNGGNTTSQPGGSVVPFSGDDVPEWDFDNATLDGDATTVGVGYDYNWYSRFQNEYYYQVGRNLIEGAPTTGNIEVERYTEMLFSIYNMRTTEVEFLYHFELSEARKTYLLETEDFDYNYMWLRLAYDQEDTILALLTLRLPTGDEVALGGDYAPIETYLASRFNIDQEESWNEYTVLLRFDVNDNTEYTILDAYDRDSTSITVNDILIEDGKLFLSTQVNKFTIDNPLTNAGSKFSFLDIPESYPTFVNYQQNIGNPQFSYLVEVDFSNAQAFETIRTTAISFDGSSNVWFYGFRQGFETKYINENGEMALGLNGYLYPQNEAAITTHFTDLENNFLTTEEETRLYPLVEAKAKEFYNRTAEYAVNFSMNINFNMFGFYNFETGLMTKNNYAVYAWQSVTIDTVRYQFTNNYSSNIIAMSDGETAFLIESEISTLYPEQLMQYNYGGWSGLSPDYRVYTYNALSSVNLDTNEVTLIEENDDNGKYVAGVYQKNGGYYLTGTYYETEATRDVQSTDAFLIEVDEDFNIVNELVLAGSGDDNGSQITLNSQGRPVWLVSSNSTDGDFAEAGASNTDGRYKVYSVTF
jgi:hypothetical protein